MKPLLLILICSLFFIPINAQTINKTETDKKTDSFFKQFTEHTPGAAVTVLQNGQTVTKKNYGRAHLEHVIPFTHETPVRLVYSMGREFMSVGLAMMEADGLLR